MCCVLSVRMRNGICPAKGITYERSLGFRLRDLGIEWYLLNMTVKYCEYEYTEGDIYLEFFFDKDLN